MGDLLRLCRFASLGHTRDVHTTLFVMQTVSMKASLTPLQRMSWGDILAGAGVGVATAATTWAVCYIARRYAAHNTRSCNNTALPHSVPTSRICVHTTSAATSTAAAAGDSGSGSGSGSKDKAGDALQLYTTALTRHGFTEVAIVTETDPPSSPTTLNVAMPPANASAQDMDTYASYAALLAQVVAEDKTPAKGAAAVDVDDDVNGRVHVQALVCRVLPMHYGATPNTRPYINTAALLRSVHIMARLSGVVQRVLRDTDANVMVACEDKTGLIAAYIAGVCGVGIVFARTEATSGGCELVDTTVTDVHSYRHNTHVSVEKGLLTASPARVLLFDDIVSSGGTLTALATTLAATPGVAVVGAVALLAWKDAPDVHLPTSQPGVTIPVTRVVTIEHGM